MEGQESPSSFLYGQGGWLVGLGGLEETVRWGEWEHSRSFGMENRFGGASGGTRGPLVWGIGSVGRTEDPRSVRRAWVLGLGALDKKGAMMEGGRLTFRSRHFGGNKGRRSMGRISFGNL